VANAEPTNPKTGINKKFKIIVIDAPKIAIYAPYFVFSVSLYQMDQKE